MAANKIADFNTLKELLHLSPDENGDKRLNELLAAFGSEFEYAEKVFVILYTNPMSKYCSKMNQSAIAAGGYKSFGQWSMSKPHVKKAVKELTQKKMLDKLEQFFEEDVQRNIDVITADRSAFRKDNEFKFNNEKGDEVTIERIQDKPLYELNKKQKSVIADFEYDKSGNAHYVIESRSQARQNLMNYYKLLAKNTADENENKTTETVVTLEAIKDKTIAKISVIQKNNEDAVKAGEFIDSMNDIDEEA